MITFAGLPAREGGAQLKAFDPAVGPTIDICLPAREGGAQLKVQVQVWGSPPKWCLPAREGGAQLKALDDVLLLDQRVESPCP